MDEEPWDAPLREREQGLEDQTNPPDLLAGWAVPSFVRTGVPMMHTPTPEDKDGKPGAGPGGPGESGDADPDLGQEDGGGLGDGILEGLDALLDLLGGLFGGGEGGPIHRGPGWHIPDPPAPPPDDNAPPGLEKPDTPVSLPPGPVVVGDDNAIIVVLVPVGEAVAIGIGLTVGLGIGIGIETIIDEVVMRKRWCSVTGSIRDCPEFREIGPAYALMKGLDCKSCCAAANRVLRAQQPLPAGCNYGHFDCSCPA
jgi:hypothetical protein